MNKTTALERMVKIVHEGFAGIFERLEALEARVAVLEERKEPRRMVGRKIV